MFTFEEHIRRANEAMNRRVRLKANDGLLLLLVKIIAIPHIFWHHTAGWHWWLCPPVPGAAHRAPRETQSFKERAGGEDIASTADGTRNQWSRQFQGNVD
jgi:hypothetical protein